MCVKTALEDKIDSESPFAGCQRMSVVPSTNLSSTRMLCLTEAGTTAARALVGSDQKTNASKVAAAAGACDQRRIRCHDGTPADQNKNASTTQRNSATPLGIRNAAQASKVQPP